MTAKKWTLKSIAAQLGVSNATVSNAFNRPDQLSKQKREEILSACHELGYFGPNQAARSLRKGTFNIVALVLPDSVEYMVSDPVASSFMRGVAKELEPQGINLLLFSGGADNVNNIVDFVDGFICYGRPRNAKLIDHLEALNKEVVAVDFELKGQASVNIDNYQAAYEVSKQALAAFHDAATQANVAILGLRLLDTDLICRVYDHHLPKLNTSIAHQRLAGFRQALQESHIALSDDKTWNIPESSERWARIAAKEALNVQPRPNVLLCMSDLIALAAAREALEQGIKVPEELKIVGFDGIDEAQLFNPAITTIHQNSEAKGQRAAELFMSKQKQQLILPFELKVGQST
ncbi:MULTISPECIES: LacI family DNA-binding transcriptional regulator [Pseudoalteromonas]|uniref:LacI family transcriptional regulator n=1 Tax=Pseudoalteromonas amylolytica TaxID=1859457 RepID=A0A1S1MR67_9GAMM|nr:MULTISPECIES: LacI family DNA-binding transcriptional regulator [Pseudoalteromonas]OHU86285.1 LacI family transcriptional regulator [Pseudoalteromonas sp. JW3]OHU89610.1 LacI family transcriptional regulator [Pseudoalteromonas amylolytica]